ncbi:hypothetical protein [Rhodohalobacter sp. 8-1]|uniref:hypothetical protein n=1 Tax=Rhodohalobacter sp. 8-1 TaxID=3131972 RepID=UPI0030EE9C79
MKKLHLLLFSVIAITALTQCEAPESPDFILSSKIDTPFIAESNFQFFGGSNALIDTSSADLNDLLSIDGENFITISREESFDFGDIENAIPAIEVAPTAISTEVGEIELSSFSSQNGSGNVGQAGFEDLTGQPSLLQAGDPIPGAESPFPVNIDLSTDYFVSAQIKSGSIVFTFRNELGFDLDDLTLELFSETKSLGIVSVSNFEHGSTRMEGIELVDESQVDAAVDLRDINVNVTIAWSSQLMKADPGDLIVQSVEGENLIATQVDAIIPAQEFHTSGNTAFSENEFLFTDQQHYAEFASGELLVDEIINSIDVDIEDLQISFPALRLPPYAAEDSLVIHFSGDSKIQRNTTTPTSRSVSLDDIRIYATNNTINYNIFAITEDTQQSDGSDSRIINSSDEVNAQVGLRDLVVREVFGIVQNRQVLLNMDVASDGATAEIMNDLEAEVINIDGIDEISRRVEGIEFTQASLNVIYQTNVNISTSVIAAFLGTDANGNEFFLSGMPGTETEVLAGDSSEKLIMNGTPIPKESLIKFDIEGSGNPEDIFSKTFDRNNSNISEFFNRLPVSIRFVGLADINKKGDTGRITNPVQFKPSIAVNIPLALRAELATFTDTTSADLSDLPGPDDDSFLEEGSLKIRYINNIPLGVNLQLEMLDDTGTSLTSLPLSGGLPIEFKAASTGGDGFSSSSAEDYTIISLNREQLDQLNKTRDVRLTAGLNSSNAEEVKIRNTDDVSISVSGNFVIRNKIN